MSYRYWCGECGYKTAWGTESQGEQQQVDHYVKQHPGIPAGGQVEFDRRRGTGGSGHGCLKFLGVVVLLLILAAACHR